MSAYVSFALKDGQNVFHSLGDFSRSTIMYEVLGDNVCWEKWRPLTHERINKAREELREMLSSADKSAERVKSHIDFLRSCSNLDEAFERLYDYEDTLDEIAEHKSEIEYAMNFLTFIEYIYQGAVNYNYDAGVDAHRVDINQYIFYGVEAPIDPTKKNEDGSWE